MKQRTCRTSAIAALLAGTTAIAAPAVARAFCGFYVSGADAKLYNNATMVVLMRDGTRTVLSMQNNYQGPPQDFAMVVPVPVVLKETDVKTLPRAVFDRVDLLAAPRLVEYWEQDPCATSKVRNDAVAATSVEMVMEGGGGAPPRDYGVKIEAQFQVGEYQIVILSAQDSTGLDAWLRANHYKIPAGAEAVLRPYVQQGMKFFVARVDIDKVQRDARGQAELSPLRFHYDSDSFNLPVRLGLINSAGKQDLIVHVLARGARYDVANYPNVAIPTNLEVAEATRGAFGAFYAALFDRVLERNPGAVVTEYAWSAGSCDPCPQEPLSAQELTTLGADVLPTYEAALAGRAPSELQYSMPAEFVLTRLHARYGAENLGEDLVFKAAPPIVGGREFSTGQGGLEQGARRSEYGGDNFQARYIIRHPWTGPIACAEPRRGVWGGPPTGEVGGPPVVARDLAFAPRDQPLSSFLAKDVEELGVQAAPLPGGAVKTPDPEPIGAAGGCARCDAGTGSGLGALGLGGLLLLARRRRRERTCP